MITYILVLIIIILLYSSFMQIKKQKKYENIIDDYDNKIDNFINSIENVIKKLDEIDIRGSFKSDDEVGFVWEELKKQISELDNEIKLNLPGVYYEKEEE